MADSPLKTKAKKKKKKRERIAEAVRWVSAIFEDRWFGSEDWMVLQGHNSVGVEKKIVAVELENCEMVEKREMAVAMLEFGANAPGFYGNYAQYLSFRCYVTFKSLSQ